VSCHPSDPTQFSLLKKKAKTPAPTAAAPSPVATPTPAASAQSPPPAPSDEDSGVNALYGPPGLPEVCASGSPLCQRSRSPARYDASRRTTSRYPLSTIRTLQRSTRVTLPRARPILLLGSRPSQTSGGWRAPGLQEERVRVRQAKTGGVNRGMRTPGWRHRAQPGGRAARQRRRKGRDGAVQRHRCHCGCSCGCVAEHRVGRCGVACAPCVYLCADAHPSQGFLHIGHAKACFLDFGLANQKGGVCYFRLDDTNPKGETQEYIDSITRVRGAPPPPPPGIHSPHDWLCAVAC